MNHQAPTSMRNKLSLIFGNILILSIATAALLMFGSVDTQDAHSAPVTGFQPGNIMSDSVFTNKNSMTASQIQSFLNSRAPYCDTQGTRPSEYGGGTRRQYAASRGVQPPFTCLKNYSQGGKSAARIIYDAAQEFSINPQVLIVLLQKEQGLVTDEWPWPVQYRAATGYGCPDTAACDREYYGFTNQVRWAGRMFRAIMNNSPTWYTPYKLGNNRIYWHPDLSRCGSSTVNIQNRTTVALYSYTPYRPNTAALNAGYGTGNSCSSYGNRNFYQYFKDWFGNPRANVSTVTFTSLDTPRWMRLNTSLSKKNLPSRKSESKVLKKNTELFFTTKATVGGTMYLRTESDTNNNISKGIEYRHVDNISPEYVPLDRPRPMEASANTFNKEPITSQNISPVPKGNVQPYSTKISVGNEWYLRTESDTSADLTRGVPLSSLQNTSSAPTEPESPIYEQLDTPRWLYVSRDLWKVDIKSGNNTGKKLSSGMHIYFDSKVTINGTTYLRTRHDTSQSYDRGIDYGLLSEIPLSYVSLDRPRQMTLLSSTRKQHPTTEQLVDGTLSSGRKIKFQTKILIGGEWYLRSETDTDRSNDKVIPLSTLR